MPLLFSVVARGQTVLAKYAACVGNFEDIIEKILPKIPPQNDKLTYTQGPYLFHYIYEDGIIYMCISDDVRIFKFNAIILLSMVFAEYIIIIFIFKQDFQRSRAFLYLNEIKRRFLATYGTGAQTALAYAMNTEFSRVLVNEMVII